MQLFQLYAAQPSGLVQRLLQALKQRQQQLASVRQTLDDAQAQVLALQEQGRPAEGLEVARSAQGVVAAAEVADPALAERAGSLVTQAEARFAGA